MRFGSAWSSALCLYSQMSPSSPTSMSLRCPGLCRFATCLFRSAANCQGCCGSCSAPSPRLWSLTSLGFPLSAPGIYRAHEAASCVVFPEEAAHSEHCGSESEGDNQVGWDMRKRWCVLLSAFPRAQGVPQQPGTEAGSQHQGLLGRLGVQIHAAGWDSPHGAGSDGQIQLGITRRTLALGMGPVLCLSLRWTGFSQPFLESCRGAGSAASWSHSKHVTGQEGTREWSEIHEIQLGLSDEIAFCDEMPGCGDWGGVRVDA